MDILSEWTFLKELEVTSAKLVEVYFFADWGMFYGYLPVMLLLGKE